MLSKRFLKFSILLSLSAAIGCGPNQEILKSNANQPLTESTVASNSGRAADSAESEVENMRTADFEFILVLRRKDGGVMQADDKSFVKTVTTNANRRSLTDGDKAIVIGANSKVPPELIAKLSQRFAVQDFSKPEAENSNSNSPANANIVR